MSPFPFTLPLQALPSDSYTSYSSSSPSPLFLFSSFYPSFSPALSLHSRILSANIVSSPFRLPLPSPLMYLNSFILPSTSSVLFIRFFWQAYRLPLQPPSPSSSKLPTFYFSLPLCLPLLPFRIVPAGRLTSTPLHSSFFPSQFSPAANHILNSPSHCLIVSAFIPSNEYSPLPSSQVLPADSHTPGPRPLRAGCVRPPHILRAGTRLGPHSPPQGCHAAAVGLDG